MFGNQAVDFNSAFNSSSSGQASTGTPNLMDDLLVPERQNGAPSSSNASNVDNGRMTGDLDQGLQRMAQSLGR